MNRFVNLVEVISEGEIEGLVNGANSIYLDQTPLLNGNGSKNFTGVSFDLHPGSAGQSYFASNPTAESATAVGALLLAGVEPTVRTITDPNATSVRLLFTVPQLSSSGPGGDAGWAIDWAVDLMPSGGGWSQVAYSSTGYNFFNTPQTFQTVIALPATGYPWSIRVRRTTGNPGLYPVFNGQFYQNYSFFGDLNWESFTTVVSAKLSYPHTAACALVIDANAYGQASLPTRSYKVRGLKIDVPSNYNPTTRAYSGVWDGAFKKAWTNNPAWILRDLLVNDRYGLGEFLTDAMIDKWALYQIAQYCDQSVPNGYGGSEPRYTLNCQITSKTEAFKLIQSIAAVFRGMAFWSMNSVYATADMPSDPVKLYSNANVINGEFNYSGTAIKARHSVALVTWYDPTDFYRPAVEVVIDDEMLKKFGWRELNLEAMGCTTRSLANRYGRWALDTEKNASESVEFVAGWDTADVNPGDIIAVADAHKAMVRAGGRLVAVAGTTLTLDAPFAPTAGQNYQLMVELPNGAVGTRAISSFSGATVVVASAYTMVSDAGATVTASPLVGAIWTITGTDLAPRQFRVMSREEREPHLFHIAAILHDPTKYARIEQGVSFDVIPYYRPPSTIKPPSNIAFQESLFQQDGKAQTKLTVSWTPGDDFLSVRYNLVAVTPTTTKDIGQIAQTSFTLDNPEIGDWTFEIYAISPDGVMSETVTGKTTVKGWAAVEGPSVSHLEVNGGGATFSGQDCKIVWTNNFPATSYDYGNEPTGAGGGTTNPFYKDNVVRVYDVPTNTLLRTDVVFTESYTYTFANNTADYKGFGKNPQRSFRFEVSVRDTLGRESSVAKLVAENPAPALVIPTVSVSLTSIFVTFTPPTDSDYAGCIIWLETNDGFNPLTTTPVYDGPSNALSFPAEPKTTYYVRLACFDAFDKNNLNISPPVSIYMTGIVVDTTPPEVPTGLTLATTTTTNADGSLDYTVVADWADSPSENFAYFDVAFAEDAPTPVFISYQTTTSIYRWNGLKPNQAYRVKVRAWSKNGFESIYSAEQTISTAAKSTPPGAPGNLTASASLRSVFLSWTNPTDRDLAGVEIWRGASNVLASAVKIGATLGSGFTDTGLTTGVTYFYWIRPFNTSGVYADYTGPTSIAPGTLATIDVGSSVITTTHLSDLAVNAAKIANNAVVTEKIADAAIATGKIAANAVTAVQIADLAITATKVADAAIVTAKIADDAINAAKIAIGAVGSDEIAAGSVIAGKIAAGAIIADKIATGAVTTAKLAAGAVTATEIAAGAITTAKIAAGAITANEIAANTITATQIATNAITATQIAANAITAGKIAANAVTATEIAAGSIVTTKLATGAVTANELAAGAVTTDKLVAGAVTASKVTVQGPSIFPDPFFDDAAMWIVESNGWYFETAAPSNGSHNLGLRRTAIFWTGAYSGTSRRHLYNPFQKGLSANQVLTLRARGYNSDPAQSVYASIQMFDSASNYIGGFGVEFPPNTVSNTLKEAQYTVPTNCYYYRIILYNQAQGPAWTGAAYIGDVQLIIANTGGMIVDGAIVAAKIAAGAITADKIAATTITASQIALNTITGDRIAGSTSLPATITVGASGITMGQLTDPAALVNSNATSIQPGKVLIAGASTLASWLNGGDNTKIDGGAIAANTISTNRLTVGARGVTIEGIEFSSSGNTLSWTAGKISYFNEAGAITVVNISAGAVAWTTGTVYVGWYRDRTYFDYWTTAALNYDNWISMATYRGGTDYIVNYGRTIIDGAKILTGTIGANQIAAGAIQTDKLAANAVTAAKIGAGEITSDKIAASAITADKIAANVFTADKIAANSITSDKIAANAVTAEKIAVGAVSASSISVTQLSSFTSNLGTITAGLMQSTDGKFVVDLTNKTITISD